MVNLTHASGIVQVVYVQNREIFVTALAICGMQYPESQIKFVKIQSLRRNLASI